MLFRSVPFIETTEVNRSRELRCQNIMKVGIFEKPRTNTVRGMG